MWLTCPAANTVAVSVALAQSRANIDGAAAVCRRSKRGVLHTTLQSNGTIGYMLAICPPALHAQSHSDGKQTSNMAAF